jgi:hypothetical protein
VALRQDNLRPTVALWTVADLVRATTTGWAWERALVAGAVVVVLELLLAGLVVDVVVDVVVMVGATGGKPPPLPPPPGDVVGAVVDVVVEDVVEVVGTAATLALPSTTTGKVTCALWGGFEASSTSKVTRFVPKLVGVPDIAPFVGSRARPAGRLPSATDHV